MAECSETFPKYRARYCNGAKIAGVNPAQRDSGAIMSTNSNPGSTPEAGVEKPGDDAPAGTPGTGDDVCPQCQGSGSVAGKTCEACKGTGIVTKGIGGA
jgi:hypothetical protein